jgi:hypothetical protein
MALIYALAYPNPATIITSSPLNLTVKVI